MRSLTTFDDQEMRHTQDYARLPTTSSSYDLLNDSDRTTAHHKAAQHDGLIFWTAVGVAISTILSCVMVFITTSGRLSPVYSSSEPQIVRHIRPNPYMHLEHVLANATIIDFEPIVNFPPVSLQFNTEDPARLMHEETRERATFFGSVYPDDRHIIVTTKLSTVVQFRNMDYAMDCCMLNVEIPQFSGTFNPHAQLTDPSYVDVWMLDSPTELSPYIAGSMTRAPLRKFLLATLTFSTMNASISEAFLCPSGGFTTLELACPVGSLDCNVDFWQDQRAQPRGGVYLKQYASLSERT